MSRRVVITGVGVVSPIGVGTQKFWDNLIDRKSGVDKITFFNASKYPSRIAGEIRDFDPTVFISKKRADNMDRSTQFMVAAAKMAVYEAGLNINDENREKIQIITGTALGGLVWILEQQMKLVSAGLEGVHKYTAGIGLSNSHSGDVSIELNVKGPSETFSVACSSAYSALASALMKIDSYETDIVIVGGSDAPIWPLQYGTLCALGVHSKKNDMPSGACRPFSVDRDGMVLGEGAAALVVEAYDHAVARKADIYAEVVGCGITCEAYGMFHHKNSTGEASRAIRMALKMGRTTLDGITYINAHGLGAIAGDICEANAIKDVFKDRSCAVTSVKASVGHALAGGGAIQLATSALSIKHGVIPPIINFTSRDPLFDGLDIVTESRRNKVKAILNNSFAFHGKNAVIILKEVS